MGILGVSYNPGVLYKPYIPYIPYKPCRPYRPYRLGVLVKQDRHGSGTDQVGKIDNTRQVNKSN